MNVWLVRHAQPCIAPGCCYGALDVAAEAGATHQAALALAQVLPAGVRVRVSPLQRCEQLAQCLRGLRPDLAYETDVRLAEMHFGQWEGVPWSEIPRAALDAWVADFGAHRFGGGESANQVMLRVAGVWADTLAGATQGAQDTVWITHAGVARAASLLAQGVARVDCATQWPRAAPGFGQWTVLAHSRPISSSTMTTISTRPSAPLGP